MRHIELFKKERLLPFKYIIVDPYLWFFKSISSDLKKNKSSQYITAKKITVKC